MWAMPVAAGCIAGALPSRSLQLGPHVTPASAHPTRPHLVMVGVEVREQTEGAHGGGDVPRGGAEEVHQDPAGGGQEWMKAGSRGQGRGV